METCPRWMPFAVVACLLAGNLGCGEPPPENTDEEDAGSQSETSTVENDGRVCPFNTGGRATDGLEAGDVSVRVYFDKCLSGSCHNLTAKNCTAELEGDTVTVTSEMEYKLRNGAEGCSGDCGGVIADCELGNLETGDYTLEHGDTSFTFSIPADDAQCVGESPFGPM